MMILIQFSFTNTVCSSHDRTRILVHIFNNTQDIFIETLNRITLICIKSFHFMGLVLSNILSDQCVHQLHSEIWSLIKFVGLPFDSLTYKCLEQLNSYKCEFESNFEEYTMHI